jgi:hypothetical protein
MASSDSDRRPVRTIRELGGEVWAELSSLPEGDLPWQVRSDVVDVVMGVLARHGGSVLENDPDLPVAPLPIRKHDDSD